MVFQFGDQPAIYFRVSAVKLGDQIGAPGDDLAQHIFYIFFPREAT